MTAAEFPVDRYGTMRIKETEDHFVEVTPMTYGKGRIVLTRKDMPYLVDDGWCYECMTAAVLAAVVWNPETEPEPVGWFRNPQTGRRRPDADAAREYVQP